MLKVFLWLRYLRKKKMVFLSIAAVAVSVALMVSADSLFTGYIDAIRRMTLADFGDISMACRGGTFEDYQVFMNELAADPNITAVAPFLIDSGLLYVEGGIVREVGLYGIDPSREASFSDWHARLLRQGGLTSEPDFSAPDSNGAVGVWLGINVIAEPNENTDQYDFADARRYIGKRMILTTAAGGKRLVEKLVVSDIAVTGNFFGDQTVYVPLERFRQMMFGSGQVNSPFLIKLKVRRGVVAESLFPSIERKWDKFAVEYLKRPADEIPHLSLSRSEQWYADVFEDLHNQRQIVLLIFGVICSAAILLIFCIFYMIVTAKQKDIAIIKSCGASRATAAAIFGGFGVLAGVVGSAGGVILAIVIINNVNILEGWVRIIFGIKLWRTSSYGLAEIPHQVHWPQVPLFVVLAIAGCAIGVLAPAIIAACRDPVKILRYE
jgi:lipoprotein-releasing system permease protein